MASSTVAVSGAIAAAGASPRCRNRAARVAAKAPTARLGAREFVGQRLKPERVRSRRSAALAPRAEAISDPVEEKDAKAEEVSRRGARYATSTLPTPANPTDDPRLPSDVAEFFVRARYFPRVALTPFSARCGRSRVFNTTSVPRPDVTTVFDPILTVPRLRSSPSG